MLVGGLAATAVGFVYVVRVTEGLPDIQDLAQYHPPVMSRVQAGSGQLVAEYGLEHRVFVPIEAIPPQVIQAFISAEDKNFYHHGGVEPIGMLRAGVRNAFARLKGQKGPLQGGSTITQQVVKNFKLGTEQNLKRKVREIVLAYRLEQAYTKDKILELYLNEIYLGRQAYGVAAASLLYFGKPLGDLTLGQMAFLASLPKAPGKYNLTTKKDLAIARRNYVLDRMEANGYITHKQADTARGEDLIEVEDRLTGTTYQAAEYFVEEVRRIVFKQYGEEQLYNEGLSIRTTLDTRMQVAARDALRAGLESYDHRHGYRGPVTHIEAGDKVWRDNLARLADDGIDLDADWVKAVVLKTADDKLSIGMADGKEGVIPLSELTWAQRFGTDDKPVSKQIRKAGDAGLAVGDVIYVAPLGADDNGARLGQFGLRQIPEANGAIIALDPHTGRILALVGGYSHRLSQFDRATQAQRQPGSSFKPFVYAAALDVKDDQGNYRYTPVSKVIDGPFTQFVGEAGQDGSIWKPDNFRGEGWLGPTTLRIGIEQSRNMITARLATDMGLEHMSEYGEKFGVYDHLPPYTANALGAYETTLLRMASGYAGFVNGGYKITPTFLDRVQDRDGKTIYKRDERICTDCNVDPDKVNWNFAPVPKVTDTRERIEDPVTAYQIVSLLEGVVRRGTAATTVGAALDWPLAGKTGTSNDSNEVWFIGFSPDLVCGVYVGFDTRRSLGDTETGGRVAAPVFRDFMAVALEGASKIPFRQPPGVSIVRINRLTGERARPGEEEGVIDEAFRPGTEPTNFDDSGAVAAGETSGNGIRVADPFEQTNSPQGPVAPRRAKAAPAEQTNSGALGQPLDSVGGAAQATPPPTEAPSTQQPRNDKSLGGLY
jgi:penicillin-binding protein 1A